jgi:hypothetical protein
MHSVGSTGGKASAGLANGEIHVQLAVNYGEDPKLRALARFGRDARACRDLYVQMVCHCKRNLTDGFVLAEELGVLVYPDSPKTGKRDADRLAEVGLVEATEGGYFVLAFLKRNKSRAQVEAISAAKAASGRKGGTRSGEVRRAEANTKHFASGSVEQSASDDEANAKHAASVRLNTETEVIGQRHVPTTSDAAKPRRRRTRSSDEEFSPGPVVAAFVEGATDAGLKRPASSICARVGKDARALWHDGYEPERLIASARTMGAGEWNDLAVQVRKDDVAANGGHRPSRGGASDDLSGEVYGQGRTQI